MTKIDVLTAQLSVVVPDGIENVDAWKQELSEKVAGKIAEAHAEMREIASSEVGFETAEV